MTYRGHIKSGAVVLDEPADLPEGAEVRVDVLPVDTPGKSQVGDLMKYAGIIGDLPSDLASNHDHYLYGVPKR
jgi:hypothetical protein